MFKNLFKSKKRTAVLSIYFLIFLYVIVLRGYPWTIMWLSFGGFTLLLLLINYSSVIAVIGNYLYLAGRKDQGLRFIRLAIKHNTKSPAAHLNYAVCILKDGNTDEALPLLQKAQSLNPGVIADKNIMLTMSSCYWLMGDLERAIELLEKLRKRYEYVNCRVLTTLGYMYLASGDFEKSRAMTELAIADDSSSGAAWDNMGQIEYKTGNIEKAKECFEKAVSLKEDLPDSYYFLGLIAKDENNAAEANRCFEKALSCTITALNTVSREQIQQAQAGVK